MPALVNPRPNAARSLRTVGPPPLPDHHSGPSADFLDEAADDVRRLTAEIDRVLTGRPAPPRATSPSLLQSEAASRLESGRVSDNADTFSWQDAAHRVAEGGAEHAAGWLGRVKRERRFARVKSVVSWAVALGFAAAIIGISAYVLYGGVPEAAAVERAVRALGL